jgi:hypothetical protein
MGRLVRIDSPSTERQRLRRTIAEALHLLVKKPELDAEAKDLAALIVLALREISQIIETSATAWDKRHYYIKADQLRAEWEWAERAADRMENVIRAGDWPRLPVALASLVPRFRDVKVAKVTRSNALWSGAYARLIGS